MVKYLFGLRMLVIIVILSLSLFYKYWVVSSLGNSCHCTILCVCVSRCDVCTSFICKYGKLSFTDVLCVTSVLWLNWSCFNNALFSLLSFSPSLLLSLFLSPPLSFLSLLTGYPSNVNITEISLEQFLLQWEVCYL